MQPLFVNIDLVICFRIRILYYTANNFEYLFFPSHAFSHIQKKKTRLGMYCLYARVIFGYLLTYLSN